MTTSGTYTFALENIEIIEEAFERCGVDPVTLTARHLHSAKRSMDLLLVEWANKGIRLWTIESQTTPLVIGTATYSPPTNIITVLGMVLRASGNDTPVFPMARDEYQDTPNKTSQGFPSRYWFDRDAVTPMITLWQVPNAADAIVYYYMRRVQDSGALTQAPEIPYRWIEAFIAGLAKNLAGKFATDREQKLSNQAQARFKEADTEDRERAPTTFRVRY